MLHKINLLIFCHTDAILLTDYFIDNIHYCEYTVFVYICVSIYIVCVCACVCMCYYLATLRAKSCWLFYLIFVHSAIDPHVRIEVNQALINPV